MMTVTGKSHGKNKKWITAQSTGFEARILMHGKDT